MKDLDFDEIDKAVNSVISGTASGSDGKADASSADSTGSKTVVPESKANPVTNTPQSPAVRRSSGQFMDVVHPSSDMRRMPVGVPERPVKQDSSLPKPDTAATIQSDQPAPTDNEADIPLQASQPTTDSYNDADIDKLSDDIDKVLGQQTPDTALESPFIAGTKVEKRPLGAFSAGATAETDEQSKDEGSEKTDFASDPVPEEASTEVESALPAELQEDLLKIEADSSTNPEVSIASDEPAAKDEALSDNPETEANAEGKEDKAPKKEAVEVAATGRAKDSESTEPTSIVQQYTEQPNSGDQSTGAIYDTNSYHKSLIHPIKKKSIWVWVMYAAILLFVGGVVGVAMYYFVIPLLSSL